jgi:hypothetical protein
MKYLYLIFRLFKCPHKWMQEERIDKTRKFDSSIVSIIFVLKCTKCGRMKNHEVRS